MDTKIDNKELKRLVLQVADEWHRDFGYCYDGECCFGRFLDSLEKETNE